jgi:uncharacterized protein with HEPN domain
LRSDRLRLEDILGAIDEVAKYFPNDRGAFDRDPLLQSHIFRHVMIVGEASWTLSQQIKDAHPHIPWKQMAGMRHIMVHDYFKVDWNVVYRTAKDNLPALRPQIEAILASLPPDPSAP